MKLFLFVIIASVTCQTVLQFDQYVTGTISPGQDINYTFISPISDGSIIIECTGPDDFTNEVVGLFNPPVVVQFVSPGNNFGSAGTDINGRHGFGVICNGDISMGQQYFFRLFLPRSPSPQNFGLRIRAEPNASLNNERIVDEETCCFGSETGTGKQYYLDIPAGTTSATIFVTRDPNRPISDPDLLVNFGSCIGTSNPTYVFTLPVPAGLNTVTIDQSSSPPLQQGRYYVSMPRPSTVFGSFNNVREYYTMGACLGSGCTLNLPPPGSSTGTGTGTNSGTGTGTDTSTGGVMNAGNSGNPGFSQIVVWTIAFILFLQ